MRLLLYSHEVPWLRLQSRIVAVPGHRQKQRYQQRWAKIDYSSLQHELYRNFPSLHTSLHQDKESAIERNENGE